MQHNSSVRGSVIWVAVMVLVSVCVGMFVNWRAPGLGLSSRNWLIRTRGPLSLPQDIAIVAVDEKSLKQYGRFPWRRSVFAKLIEKLTEAHPKVIALNVLFTESSQPDEDARLAAAIRKSGIVVGAAQVTEKEGGQVEWLRPLPELAPAAVGHVHVSTEENGMAGAFLIRKSDDEGISEWAMPIESIRVADGLATREIEEDRDSIHFGSHSFPFQTDTRSIEIETGRPRSLRNLQAGWIPIEYVGPPGTWSALSFSVADVLEGKTAPAAFTNKYVIVGATAAGMGDRFTSPFAHMENVRGGQAGELISGTEVLANSVNTLLRNRFYRDTPDFLAAVLAGFASLTMIGLLSLAQGKNEILKQAAALILVPTVLVAVSYIGFAKWLVYLPFVPSLISVSVAAPLSFLRRNLEANRELDLQIQEVSRAAEVFWISQQEEPFNMAPMIALVAQARLALILAETSSGRFQVLASSRLPSLPRLPAEEVELAGIASAEGLQQSPAVVPASDIVRRYCDLENGNSTDNQRALVWPLKQTEETRGFLLLLPEGSDPISPERARTVLGIASAYLAARERTHGKVEGDAGLRRNFRRYFPRGIAWKSRAVRGLQRRLVGEAQFVEHCLRSIGEGLLVTDAVGQIMFANERATEILGLSERALKQSNLFDRLSLDRSFSVAALERLLVDRQLVEREVTLGATKRRHYTLRLNAVRGTGEASDPLGIVASLSDITHQHELQEMKSDVISLVTHEMRTPLTAIQGMSEILAEFQMDAARGREMHLAINDEAKRLSRMIDEYLDITKLEAGARPLRKESLRADLLVEQVLRLLEPTAERRGVRIERVFEVNVRGVLADADLLTRAVTNLVGNALKFSQKGFAIRVIVRKEQNEVVIAVSDRGPGIAESDLPHIFEKFYRVQNPDMVDESGSGLGLAFVQEIMDAHGGYVSVESKVGVGSRFSLHFPQGNASSRPD